MSIVNESERRGQESVKINPINVSFGRSLDLNRTVSACHPSSALLGPSYAHQGFRPGFVDREHDATSQSTTSTPDNSPILYFQDSATISEIPTSNYVTTSALPSGDSLVSSCDMECETTLESESLTSTSNVSSQATSRMPSESGQHGLIPGGNQHDSQSLNRVLSCPRVSMPRICFASSNPPHSETGVDP